MPGKPIRTLRGNPRDNIISGTDSDELIYGYAGDDQLFGGGGADFLHGGTGDDRLDGGTGSDILYGGEGFDILLFDGGASGDVEEFHGDAGEDSLDLRGATTAIGVTATGNLAFTLQSASGAIGSGTGIERFWASNHGGTIDLSAASSIDGYYVHGGTGNDIIHTASAGATVVYGGNGDDSFHLEVTGGPSNVGYLYGGENDYSDGGWDSVVLGAASIVDGGGTVHTNNGDGNSGWHIANFRYIDEWIGSAGADWFRFAGTLEPLTIHGGGGDDAVFAGAADDTIFGDAGDDHLEGGGGADVIDGGDGDDYINGAAGRDGDTNPDGVNIIVGGLGQDTLVGGVNVDIFVFSDLAESPFAAPDTLWLYGSDLIDLQQIDAVSGTADDDAFQYIGSNAFSSTAGELRLTSTSADNSQWLVEGDVDGDGEADFALVLLTYGATPTLPSIDNFIL